MSIINLLLNNPSTLYNSTLVLLYTVAGSIVIACGTRQNAPPRLVIDPRLDEFRVQRSTNNQYLAMKVRGLSTGLATLSVALSDWTFQMQKASLSETNYMGYRIIHTSWDTRATHST